MKKRLISIFLILVMVVVMLPISASAATSYTITVLPLTNGTVTVSSATAEDGDTVYVTITPASGYVTKVGSPVYMYEADGYVSKPLVNRANDNTTADLNGYKMRFTMPAANVYLYAEFVSDTNDAANFDVVACAVRSSDESFDAGTFDGIRFLSRLYFKVGSRNTTTGVITLRKDGTRTRVSEIGVLRAPSARLGTNEITYAGAGSNGIVKTVCYSSDDPLSTNLFDTTKSYVDFVAQITSKSDISTTDYTVRSYIKFADDDILYSSERTDFADNTAQRLGLCSTADSAAGATALTVSNGTAVNSSFGGFGAVMYPWTDTIREGGATVAAAKARAYTELDRMQQSGIKKVRIIFSVLQSGHYDFTNKCAKIPAGGDWYTDIWVEMLNALKDRGIDAMINFGWGNSIQSLSNGNLTAVFPTGTTFQTSLTLSQQITAYGQLCAAYTDFFLDAGCSNVKSITFFSEPGNGWKGSTNAEAKSQSAQLNFDSVITTYGQCVNSVKTQLAALGRGSDVSIVSGNISMIYDPSSGYDWWNITSWGGYSFLSGKKWFRTMVGKSTVSSNSNAYSYHYYGKFTNAKLSNYSANKTAIDNITSDGLATTSVNVNSIMMDEVSVKSGVSTAENNKALASPFEATQLAEYLALLMNKGYKGAYVWTFSNLSSDNMFGFMPNALSGDTVPYDRYYAFSLIAKYMNRCTKIYAGTRADGCITVYGTNASGTEKYLMVVNLNYQNKAVKVDFNSSLGGATLYRHVYNPSVNTTSARADIIGFDKAFTGVTSSLTDTLPAGAVAIYTTVNS